MFARFKQFLPAAEKFAGSIKPAPIGKLAGTLTAAIPVAGFVVCAIACPSPQLVGAVCLEVGGLAFLVYWRHLRRPRPLAHTRLQSCLDWWRRRYRRQFRVGSAVQSASALLTIAAALALTVEFAGFFLAFCGQETAARTLFVNLPVSRWLTGHPAHSLEFLAGAYADAGNYRRAHPLYTDLARIRTASLPPGDELVPAIWTDIGMLYMREKQFAQAETAFRRSLSMAERAQADLMAGRLLTGLGNALREQGRYGEADTVYRQAIAMRSQKFGPGSLKVAESLSEYAVCLERAGRAHEAADCRARVAQIIASLKRAGGARAAVSPALLAAGTIFTLVISLLAFAGDTILIQLTRLILRRKAASQPLSTEEVELLALLSTLGRTVTTDASTRLSQTKPADVTKPAPRRGCVNLPPYKLDKPAPHLGFVKF